jgi:flagellar motor switch protein FliG
MAEIFNNFDRQTETRFMTALEDDNREAAERIKTLMFAFDDLTRLDSGSAQTLMRTSTRTSSRSRSRGRARRYGSSS